MNQPTPRPLSQMGLLRPQIIPQPVRVLAPAPRATRQVSVTESAHVTKLLGALLNMEDSARFLQTTPNFSGLLRDEISQIRRVGAIINARMLKEFAPEDAGVVTTINSCGNMLNRLSILLCHCPPEVADAAANAAANIVQTWHTPPKKRAAKRISQLA